MKNIPKCLNCGNILEYKQRYNKYCSKKCSATHTQRNGGNHKWSEIEKQKLSKWAKKFAYRHEKRGKLIKCFECENDFYQCPSEKQKCCSPKCFQLWNKKTGYLKGGKLGGYRKEAGRGKMGWYKGYYCNSSWELAWVIYQLDHGLNFKRNNQGFEYQFENKKYKFYPDFVLSNGEYIEIKGWITKKDEEKINQFKYPLKVIRKNDLKNVFDYVFGKYGDDYTSLYEKI